MKGSDPPKVSLNAYDMAKRNNYKRSYDFLKSALRDNNRDALVKANLRNAGNRRGAMLAAAGSSNEIPEQVTISAPAPKVKAKAKAQPCFKYQKGTYDRGDKCSYPHVGESGSAPELSAEEKKTIAEKRGKILRRLCCRTLPLRRQVPIAALGAQDLRSWCLPGRCQHTEFIYTAPASSLTAPSHIANKG